MMAANTTVPFLFGFLIILSAGISQCISEPVIDHEVTLWTQGKYVLTEF